MFKIVLVAALFALASAAHMTNRAPRLDGRIVGGHDVDIKDYPYQVSMLYFGSHMCGGSIISSKFVVTAAHCTDGSSADYLSVRAGSTIEGSGGQVINVAKIHQHPDYDSWDINSDISILELEADLVLGNGVEAIGLPNKGEEPADGSTAVCTGWGALTEGGGSPDTLQAVEVDIVNKETCRSQYAGYLISDNMICAGVNGGGKDACQGDSGGPLAVDNVLSGVVSWGLGCARPNYPGVYSSVANLRDHITKVTGL